MATSRTVEASICCGVRAGLGHCPTTSQDTSTYLYPVVQLWQRDATAIGHHLSTNVFTHRGRPCNRKGRGYQCTAATHTCANHTPSNCMRRPALKTFFALSTSLSVTLVHMRILQMHQGRLCVVHCIWRGGAADLPFILHIEDQVIYVHWLSD